MFLDNLFDKLIEKSRINKYKLFYNLLNPSQTSKILDIGAEMCERRSSDNILEKLYPYQQNIIAAGLHSFNSKCWRYPEIVYVQCDAIYLPFIDNSFDIAYSNAVIEHIEGEKQKQMFIREILRVARVVFITTPNRWFPLEVHTKIPFLSWLPRPLFKRGINMVMGKGYSLTPLSLRSLNSLFHKDVEVNIFSQGFIKPFPHFLTAVAKKSN